ncbi:MAG: phage portal protein [Acidimicrobiia bacterium]
MPTAVDLSRVYEDAWASQDPYQVNRPGLGSVSTDLFHHAWTLHNARPGSRRDGSFPPFYRTPEEHFRIIDAARLVEGLCATASNVLDVLCLFCIGTGYEYTIVSKTDGEGLVKEGQDVVDRFLADNHFYGWEREIFRRSRRDGEAFLYFEPDEVSGLPALRAIEPECVREPQDAPGLKRQLGVNDTDTWRYGILTPKQDTSKTEGIWVVSQYEDGTNVGEYIPAEELVHIKTEWPDRNAKRGVSDFFSTINQMHRTKKLLRRMTESAIAQAAIVWIRTHPEGMAVGAQGISSTNTTRAGRNVPAVHYESSTVLDVTHGMEYASGPVAEADPLVGILQAALRAIGARWQIPESLISGDASNNNLASALVAEGPFVRSMVYRQWHYKHEFQRIIERVLEYAAATGALGAAKDTVLDKLSVNVDMPAVVERKMTEETERNSKLYAAGILSKQTWSAREDLVYEDEKKLLEEDPPEMIGGADDTDGDGETETDETSEETETVE